jgi:hypothetical protein
MIKFNIPFNLYFLLFFWLLFSLILSAQTEIDTCSNSLTGEIHGHITSILECDNQTHLTSVSNQSSSSIFTGVFVSESIKITPGSHGVKLIAASHSEEDPLFSERETLAHGRTHIKAKPPTGGRFMEFKNKQAKLIFPTPAQNKITINTKEKLSSIVIYNLYGNSVIKKEKLKVSSDKTTIDIAELDKGFYIAKVQFANGTTKTETIIKN